jgi:FAD/FMN-containing dehydrogenase/Fe-S oxidoreductase
MATIPSSNIGYSAGNLQSTDVNTRALAAALRAKVSGEVRFDNGSRALYATDGSNYRQIPIGIVLPRSVEDVLQAVALCRQYGAPVLPRGGGTSLAGQCCNVAVVMDFTKYMHSVLALDPQKREARVQPGTILDDLRNAAEHHHLTFGPDPATHNHCTLGGMIGNNSCGVHSLMAGKTVDNIEELEILTYDGLRLRVGSTSDGELEHIIGEGGRRGQIYSDLKMLRNKYAPLIRERYPLIPRRVSGYNLDQLLPENGFNVARALVGSEGTCVTVLEATTQLVHSPSARSLLVLGYPDIFAAADQVPLLLEYGPIGLEGLDDRLLDYVRRKALYPHQVAQLPPGDSWLLVEFGGESQPEADGQAQKLMDMLKRQMTPPSMQLFNTPDQEQMIWLVRESGLGATAKVPGMVDTWEGWEDSAVPPEKEGAYLRDLRKLLDRYGYETALYGHFGQGCIHARITFDFETRPGIEHYMAFLGDAADLVVSYGGSLSGEHGDGQSRAALLPKMFGDELIGAFREFKAIWDPEGKMNPGKLVDAYRPDQNLRLGADFAPWSPSTHFSFVEDGGNFAKAAQRCVGVGACRRTNGGTMCPSYMVTREEADSTRGRSRLLFEMLQREVIGKDGWHDEQVKGALDLCLSCKGCKGDCPVNVDMATYKAEFLSHYYEGHARPRSALAFGRIFYWARLAAIMPGLANFFTQTPGLRDMSKVVAGVAHQRQIPLFAPQTFRAWFRRNRKQLAGSPRVLLWPDTFNNHFHPDTAKAAVAALEAVGFTVAIPRRWLCCGRPLYDFGMLDLAKKLLRNVISELRDDIRAGTPLVVLEPSCASVFRDELVNLFPNDEDAKRLCEQTVLLSEFFQKFAPDHPLPQLKRTAIVHGHCHHKAIMQLHDEEAVLTRLGLEYQVLDSGCCGMAGAFGFEGGVHYDVSIKAGERVLLPAVRRAAPDTLIITDGFSCREQISQTTDRQALHLAEVIHMATEQWKGSELPQ